MTESPGDILSSAHSRCGGWLDFIHDAHFTRLAKRVGVFAEVLLCQRVDVRVSACFDGVPDAAADLEVTVRIIGIHYSERDG